MRVPTATSSRSANILKSPSTGSTSAVKLAIIPQEKLYFCRMGIYAVARSRVNRAKAHGERLAQLWNEIPTEHLLKPKALADPDGHGVIFAAGVGEVPE